MNCTRCRHQGRTTPITHLDTRGRKWCADCDEDAAYEGYCLAECGRIQRENAQSIQRRLWVALCEATS